MKGSIQKTAGTSEDIDAVINNKAHILITSPTAPVILRNEKMGDFHLRAPPHDKHRIPCDKRRREGHREPVAPFTRSHLRG